jgi:hypothetical protein
VKATLLMVMVIFATLAGCKRPCQNPKRANFTSSETGETKEYNVGTCSGRYKCPEDSSWTVIAPFEYIYDSDGKGRSCSDKWRSDFKYRKNCQLEMTSDLICLDVPGSDADTHIIVGVGAASGGDFPRAEGQGGANNLDSQGGAYGE